MTPTESAAYHTAEAVRMDAESTVIRSEWLAATEYAPKPAALDRLDRLVNLHRRAADQFREAGRDDVRNTIAAASLKTALNTVRLIAAVS